jgi:murein peptide amidase A
VTIGLSVRHRVIGACERGTRGGVVLLAIGNIHGDETIGWRVIHELMSAPVPAGVDLWLIRSVNPDGSTQHTRGNAHGVDENRNWPADWQPSAPGSSTYSGPHALSEPETSALDHFLVRLRPHTVVVFHDPLDAVDFSDGADPAVTRFLARASGFPARRLGSRPGAFTAWFNAQRWKGTAITFEFARTATDSKVREVSGAVMALASWRAQR